jgi:hypothetical protein
MGIGYLELVISHAAAVHGIATRVEPVDLARIALRRLGFIEGRERDRRPIEVELGRLIEHFESNPRQLIPVGRTMRYAVATAMRQEIH